jgi:REP element-mobilizing transposase RayT
MAATQLDLRFPKRGGKRDGAGRKGVPGKRPGVPHRARPTHKARFPVHLTLRARSGLPSFRESALFAELRERIWKASRSPAVGEAFRIVHFSIQPDHAHFIVEASDTDALTRGAQGLSIRLAKVINNTFGGIHGPVWADRYHARELKTPREVRNAIVYVLMNAKKHVRNFRAAIDMLSSAPWFDGIRGNVLIDDDPPIMQARTWLANVGWRRRGLIEPHEKPS